LNSPLVGLFSIEAWQVYPPLVSDIPIFTRNSGCRFKRQTNLTSLWWSSVDLSDAYQIVLLKDGCCHGYLSYDLKFLCDEI
jgi:hypothetical protein